MIWWVLGAEAGRFLFLAGVEKQLGDIASDSIHSHILCTRRGGWKIIDISRN